MRTFHLAALLAAFVGGAALAGEAATKTPEKTPEKPPAKTADAKPADKKDDGKKADAKDQADKKDAKKDDELIRVPLLDGVYSVEAPAEWHVDVSGEDFTATFSEEPGSDGTLVIAPPNPLVEDIEEYTRLSIEGLFRAFGNGSIDEENHDEVGGFPAYTAIFFLETDGTPFVGWARTLDMEGYAIQAISLTSAKNYVGFMQKAGDIVDSYELDLDELRSHSVLLRRIGRQTLTDLKRSAAMAKENADGQ